MSILRSLNTGASGIRAHGQAMGATSDNIANVSTIGFKRSRAVFNDILGRAIDSAPQSMPMAGAGARVSHIQQMWSQGALLTTEAPTDLAVNGNGFFVVQGSNAGIEGQWFSRAGQFRVDNEGFLVNPDGLRLQGYSADATGNLGAALGDLEVMGGTVPANATTEVELSVQLNSNLPALAAPAVDPNDPATFSGQPVSTTVYDSLGNARELTVYFQRNATGYDFEVFANGSDLAGGTADTPTSLGRGDLTFDASGALTAFTDAGLSIDFTGGAATGQAIAMDFGTPVGTGAVTGRENSTMFGFGEDGPNVTAIAQDGFSAGTVSGFEVAADGTITGVFSNGQRRPLGQVALADFTSVDGLERAGNNLFVATLESGEPLVGGAGSGRRGSIVGGALEQSNVDLGQEFVDLIAYQRGFQANSRIITTADEMYTELINLKR
ncbi:MAG: flagellar hook protein FlgE [Myxococcota bacterium]